LIIPGEPLHGIFEEFRRVLLKSNQVMKGVDLVEGASMDETHEQIPDIGPMLGLEEKALFPMENRPFQNLFAEGIVQRDSGNP
jgi:hypothetical protein